ncbi:uncharacterized protein (DUF1800 family) [Shimia isoporae]|uniref:Uncharacterized protein (DUF1800 family) n=1 Tax=Shimia isoporae TaxID=647720 RepID=A0A4R1NM71_9RHOB|nr:DUF1800 domain-containing protein [Shimia isoporae]TCL08839.1 uncharacterized protein (DUF1800 family) [Shimia isoporae]
MSFTPVLAAQRFGYGLSPVQKPPASVNAMLKSLNGPDVAAQRFPLPSTEEVHAVTAEFRALRKSKRMAVEAGDPDGVDAEALRNFHKRTRPVVANWSKQRLTRRVWAEDGFRERLVDFWADHFAAPGKDYERRTNEENYVEVAIRPYVAGRFEDMLIAAALHPQMLHFLDQTLSIGPNSSFSDRRKDRVVGLNENLAREILELHTLGVGGSYTQVDVRELAELLTGVRAIRDKEMQFDANRAEPGAETILGKSYGGSRRASLEDVTDALRDLARHPDTARHLAEKMAIHFIADAPDRDLVEDMKAAYLDSQGDLAVMTEAMLKNPTAWSPERRNFKQPLVFVASALRGLGVEPQTLQEMRQGQLYRFVRRPLSTMGQPLGRPLGPDGFEEGDAHWLSPQGLGARLQWSLSVPSALTDPLPDPRAFVVDVLGEDVPPEVLFAAQAAESRREGVALVLMSPAFQRV